MGSLNDTSVCRAPIGRYGTHPTGHAVGNGHDTGRHRCGLEEPIDQLEGFQIVGLAPYINQRSLVRTIPINRRAMDMADGCLKVLYDLAVAAGLEMSHVAAIH